MVLVLNTTGAATLVPALANIFNNNTLQVNNLDAVTGFFSRMQGCFGVSFIS